MCMLGWSCQANQRRANEAQSQKSHEGTLIALGDIEGYPANEGAQGKPCHLYGPEQTVDGPQMLTTVVIGEEDGCEQAQTALGKAAQDRKEIRLRHRMHSKQHGQTDGFEGIRADQEGTYGESVSTETPYEVAQARRQETKADRLHGGSLCEALLQQVGHQVKPNTCT